MTIGLKAGTRVVSLRDTKWTRRGDKGTLPFGTYTYRMQVRVLRRKMTPSSPLEALGL